MEKGRWMTSSQRRCLSALSRRLPPGVVPAYDGLTVEVDGATTETDARKVGLAIANSPLVKTAVAGEDANWGRIVMAVGKSGATADRDRLSIRFGDVWVARDGWRAPDYSEEATSAYMKNQEIVIGVDLGLGRGKARVWTCDLTHGYIDINADYRS